MMLFTGVTFCQLSAQRTQEHFVLFASNSSEVTSDEAAALLDLISEQVYIRNIELHAYTDGDGSEEFNEVLSKDRLTSVEAFIEKAGYTISSSNFYGEKDPLASNEVEDGKQQNRRVQVRFEADQKILTLASVMETIKPKSQGFCINNRKDTAIVCKNGTIIGIPAGTFDYAECNDCIELRVDEMLSPKDMLLNNAHTLANGQMLSSGGSIYLEASCNGKKLNNSTNKPITYLFPSDQLQDDMTLWTSSNGGNDMNWTEKKDVVFSPLRGDDLRAYAEYIRITTTTANSFDCRFWCKLFRVFGVDLSAKYQRRTTQTEYIADVPDEILAIQNPKVRAKAIQALNEKRTQIQNYYAGEINRMNYINCDAFPDEPTEQIIVQNECNGESIVKLVFPSINGVMQRSFYNGQAEFIGASNRDAVVVSIKIEDNKSFLAIAQRAPGQKNVQLEFEELSPIQIKARLKRLDI
jgi:hypothetical protein